MKIFRRFSIVDIVILLGVIIALFVGICTAKHFRQTADKQIEATAPITFQVYLRGVTVTGTEFPVRVNEKSFITIRNVPYTELDIVSVSYQPRKTYAPNSRILVLDPAQPSVFDAVVTVKDVAKITKDGAVVGGNKIKIGLPITIEGKIYRFNGIISDIRITNDINVEINVDNNIG